MAPPAGPFSPAVRIRGALYLSMQVAQDPATGRLIDGDAARQTAQVFENLRAVLTAAGKSFADVVRAGVYLTDIHDFAAMNAVYARYFDPPYPADDHRRRRAPARSRGRDRSHRRVDRTSGAIVSPAVRP